MILQFLTFILFTATDSLLIKRNMKLEFNEIKVTFNGKYIDKGNYFMQNNNGTNELFMFGNLKAVVNAPMMGQFQLYHKNVNDHYVLTLPTLTVELCSLLKNYRSIPLSTDFVRNVRKSGSIPTKCPIKLGSYSLLHFQPQPQIFPVILPSREFRFDARLILRDNEQLLNMSAYQTFSDVLNTF